MFKVTFYFFVQKEGILYNHFLIGQTGKIKGIPWKETAKQRMDKLFGINLRSIWPLGRNVERRKERKDEVKKQSGI